MNRKKSAFLCSMILLCSLILFPAKFYADASVADTECQYSENAVMESENENLYPSNLDIKNFKGESVNSGILKITKGATIQLHYNISYYGNGDIDQLSVACSFVEGISTIITNTGSASGNISLAVDKEFSNINASMLFSVIGGATVYSQSIMLEEVPAEENDNIPPDLITPEEPASPETNTPEEPASPDLNMPTEPVNPHTNTPEEPASPETNTPEEPVSPDLNMPLVPVTPHTNTPKEPIVPETDIPTDVTKPNPSKPEKSATQGKHHSSRTEIDREEMKRSGTFPFTGEEYDIWDLFFVIIGCLLVLWSMKKHGNHSIGPYN